jgi:hypothetical protein
MKEIAAMELAELRYTLKVTQANLAQRMKVSQAAIFKARKTEAKHPCRSASLHHFRNGRKPDYHRGFRGQKVELSHIGKAGDSYFMKVRRHRTAPPLTGSARSLKKMPRR